MLTVIGASSPTSDLNAVESRTAIGLLIGGVLSGVVAIIVVRLFGRVCRWICYILFVLMVALFILSGLYFNGYIQIPDEVTSYVEESVLDLFGN